MKGSNDKRAQALLVVTTVLAMLFIIGIAFFYFSFVERTASLRHLDSLKAQYIAEAGVAYAQKILELDRKTNLIDSLEDLTFKHFYGQDIDLDEDKEAESGKFSILDSQGNLFGYFSVRILDEASKINLNFCPKSVLERFFPQAGIDRSQAEALLSRLPLNAIEEAGSIFKKEELKKIVDFLTVYSQDPEVDLERRRRVYLNTAFSQLILEKFLSSGISDPWQKAANLIDARDTDLNQTILDKFTTGNIFPSGLLEAGSWKKTGNFYEASAGGREGKFFWSNLPIEDGDYFCFFYGPDENDVIGEVYLDNEKETEIIFSGEGLKRKVKVNAGSLTINIRPHKERISRFSHIELASLDQKKGLVRKIISGSEALVINELMVKPSKEIFTDAVGYIKPAETKKYIFNQIKEGNYYVVVEALKQGGLVGDVYINGKLGGTLRDGDYFPQTISVGSKGEIFVEIKNNSLEEASFKGIKILQEPDGEYIELLNLSPQRIDLSNFIVEVYTPEGELLPGWPARIGKGIEIEPYQHLILAVDSNDGSGAPQLLRGNGISFDKIWNLNATGLIFDKYLDKTFDLLPNRGGKVVLKSPSNKIIDAVEYKEFQVSDFVSLERPDPTAKLDSDNNGVFDGWYRSESGEKATPAQINDNLGMYTKENGTTKLTKHSPYEIKVFNHPITLKEVIQLSSGKNWKKFTLSDIAYISDFFCDEAIDLVLAGHYKTGEFIEKNGVFESLSKADGGIWEFQDIPSGNYLLSILSDDLTAEGKRIQVAYRIDPKEEFSGFSSLLFLSGACLYGEVVLEKEPSFFQLKIINDSDGRVGLKGIRLEPIKSTPGRININTAKPEVLYSLFDSDALVQTILKNRPFGNKNGRRLGVGELFLLDPNFFPFYNYLTVKSDIYEIRCRGEYSPAQKTLAYQTIRTVVERRE
jgi:hypothetical protein